MAAPDFMLRPLKRLQLHALDIELDHVDPRQSERIDRIFWIVTVFAGE
jgi:hypothetical protein